MPYEHKINKINKSRAYKLKNCIKCKKFYTKQTERAFKIRLKEHLNAFKTKDFTDGDDDDHLIDLIFVLHSYKKRLLDKLECKLINVKILVC